jgi:hypothetical protein
MRSPSSTVLDQLDASWADLERAYRVDEPQNVRAFVADHPGLPLLLLEIRQAARRYFGDDPMALELFTDPEGDDAKPELVAVVTTRRGWQEALQRLREFDEGWWLMRRKTAAAPVFLSIDFI